MATFGYTSQGASTWQITEDGDGGSVAMRGTSVSGEVTQLAAYLSEDYSFGDSTYRLRLSLQSGSYPGTTYVVDSGSQTVSGTGFTLKTYAASYTMASGNWWVEVRAEAMGSGAAGADIAYDSGSGDGARAQDAFGGIWVASTNRFSIYATYTPPPLTFGYTSIGATSGNDGGKTLYYQTTPIEAGDVTQLSVYLDWAFSGTGAFYTGIYSDNADAPNTRLASAAVINKANGAAWANASITLSVTAIDYHFGMYQGGGPARWYWDTGLGGISNAGTFGLPSSAAPDGTNTGRTYSIYATYTPIPLTFGYTSAGASEDMNSTGETHAVRGFLTESGDVSKITAYVRQRFGGNGRGAIYNQDASPVLQTGASNSVAVTGGSLNWIDFTFPTNESLVSDDYYVAFSAQDSYLAYDSGTSGDSFDQNIQMVTSAFADPWSGGATGSSLWSIYATYTATGSVPSVNLSGLDETTGMLVGGKKIGP